MSGVKANIELDFGPVIEMIEKLPELLRRLTMDTYALEAALRWSEIPLRTFGSDNDGEELPDEQCPVRGNTPADAVKALMIWRILRLSPLAHFFTREPEDVWPELTRMTIAYIESSEGLGLNYPEVMALRRVEATGYNLALALPDEV